MPIHKVQAPNGRIYKIEAPEGASDADLFGYTSQLMQEDAAHEANTGFTKAVKSGWYDTKAAAWEALHQPEYAAEAKKARESVGYEPTTAEDVAQGGIGTLLRKEVAEPLGGMVGGYAAPTVAGMVAAPIVAATLPETAAVTGLAALATRAAPMIARGAMFAPAEAGHNIERQREVNPEAAPNETKAWLAALPQAALATVGLPWVKGPIASAATRRAEELAPKVLAGEITAEAAKRAVGQDAIAMAKSIGVAIPENILQATGMMVGTEALRRGQAGQDITSPEARESYGESLKTAAVLSPIFGTMHGRRSLHEAQGKVEAAGAERTQAEQTAAREAEAAARQAKAEEVAATKQMYADLKANATEYETLLKGEQTPEVAAKLSELRDMILATEGGEKALTRAQKRAAKETKGNEPTTEVPAFEELTPEQKVAEEIAAATEARAATPTPEQALEAVKPTTEIPVAKVEAPAEAPVAKLAEPTPPTIAELPPALPAVQPIPEAVTPEIKPIKTESTKAKKPAEVKPAETPIEAPVDLPNVKPLTKAQQAKAARDAAKAEAARVANEAQAREVAQVAVQEDTKAAAAPIETYGSLAAPRAEAPVELESEAVKSAPEPVVEAVPEAPKVEAPAPKAEPTAPAPKVVAAPVERAKGAERVAELEAKIAAENAKDEPNEARLEALNTALVKAEVEASDKRIPNSKKVLRTEEAEAVAVEREGRTGGFDEEAAVDLGTPKKGEMRSKPVIHVEPEAPVQKATKPKKPQKTVETAAKEPELELPAREEHTEAPEAKPLHKAAVKHLEDGNLSGALDVVSREGTNDIVRNIAKHLSKLVTETRLFLNDKLEHPETKKEMAGGVSPAGDRMWLHKEKGMNEETIVHEATHAAAERVLAMDPKARTPAQRAAVAELKRLHAEAKKSLSLSDAAKKDLSEFVAEAMSNLKLQHEMAKIKWDVKQSAWDKFKRTILNLIGVGEPKNMRDAAIAAAETIFKPVGAYKAVKGEAPREVPKDVKPALAQDINAAEHLSAAQGPTQQRDATITDKLNALKPKGTSMVLAFRAAVVDKFASVADRLGEKYPELMRQARQAVDFSKMTKEFLEKGGLRFSHGLQTYEVFDNGKGAVKVYELLKAQAQAAGRDLKEYTHVASRVLEYNRYYHLREEKRQGKWNGTIPKSIEKDLDAMHDIYTRNPEFKALNDSMDAGRFDLIDQLVSTGRLTKEQGKDFKAAVGYVPFDRLGDVMDSFYSSKVIKGGGLAQSSAFKQLVGSESRPVGDVFENNINTMGWLMSQVLKQDASSKLMHTLKKEGAAQRVHHGVPLGDFHAYIYEKGEKVNYNLLSKADMRAFTDETGKTNQITRVLSTMSNVTRTTVTAMPPFALRQVIKDSLNAAMYSGVKSPLHVMANTLAIFPRLAAVEAFPSLAKSPLFRSIAAKAARMEQLGITGEYDWQRSRPAESLLKDMGLKERKVFGSKWLGSTLHRLDAITRASDLAARMAVYERTLKENGLNSEGLAQHRARELINFSRKGSSGAVGFLRETVPFFNARLQSLDLLYRAFTGKDNTMGLTKEQARTAFLTRAGQLAAFSWAYAMMRSGDEDYDDAKLDLRDKNWLLGTVGDTGLRIPIQGELAILFKAPIERMVEYSSRLGTPEEQDAWTAVQAYFKAAYAGTIGEAPPIPVGIKAPLESMSNFSFTTLRKIEGPHQLAMNPSYRVNERTTELAKEVAEFSRGFGAEVSPIMIDNILSTQFGLLYGATAVITNSLLNPNTPETPVTKLPFASDYTYNPVGSRRLDEFYDIRERVVQAQSTMNDIAKHNPDNLEAYIKDHQAELALYSGVNRTLEALQKTRAYRDFLMNNEAAAEEYSPEERRKMLDDARKDETQLADWVREVTTELKMN